MPRPHRVQFPGAIYHVITRGDGRRRLFHDEGHYQRFTGGLSEQVSRHSWEVFAWCWMPNHVHALIRTPEPNLAAGMQHWLSGYANWYAKRNRRTGHLYQGRYKAFPVEDAGYFWHLSRYIHLNPCAGRRPRVERPESWPHSSYPGYHDRRRRLSWVLYDELHRYWAGRNGGADPQKAYRRYVREGLEKPAKPIADAMHGWVYGSESFLRRMIELGEGADEVKHRSASRRIRGVAPREVIAAVAAAHGVQPGQYAGFRSGAAGRDMAAWLCRRWTGATLTELGPLFGVTGVGSVSGLVRRAERRHRQSSTWRRKASGIEASLRLKTQCKA